MQHDPQGIMVRKDSPIHSFADLNGHTVAIKTGSTWWEYIAKRYNLNDVHEVPAMMNVANFVAESELRAAGVRDVGTVFRAAGGDRDAGAADERRGLQPVPRDVHDARFSGAASGGGRRIRARLDQGMARVPERSGGSARGHREAESRAQSRSG